MCRRIFTIPTIIFVLLSLIWVIVIPPFQTPDEQAHLRYIEFIAEEKRIPNKADILDTDKLDHSPAIQKYIQETQSDRIFHNVSYHFDFADTSSSQIDNFNATHIYNHPPLYYIWGAILYTIFAPLGIGTAMLAIRLSNILFTTICFIFAGKIAGRFTTNKWSQLAVSSVVGFWPMYMFINSGVNNDPLAFTIFTVTIYYLIDLYLDKKPGLRQLFILSALTAIGCLTKPQFLVITPIIAIVIFFKLRKTFNPKVISAFAPLILPVLYFVHNLVQFGSLFPRPAGRSGIIHDNFFQTPHECQYSSLLAILKAIITPRTQAVFKSFVGRFGWLDTQLPEILYLLAGIFFLFGIVGFMVKIYKDKKLTENFPKWAILISTVISLELFYLYLYLNSVMKHCYTGFPTQGRYYFPVIVPIFVIILAGITHIIPDKYRNTAFKAAIILVLFFNIFALSLLILRYYL